MNDFHRKKNILIISEGFEEKLYIDKILSFPNINKYVYNFPPSFNAKGNGKIFAKYLYDSSRANESKNISKTLQNSTIFVNIQNL